MLTPTEAAVASFYDDRIFELECRRLTTTFPVEYAMTLRAFAHWLPPDSDVLEIGVGGAQYSIWMADRAHRVDLVDISRRLLERAHSLLGDRAAGATWASATNLGQFATASFDAVVLLGPLYHLLTITEREKAVEEAARVLKPGGILFAAGINRLAYLRAHFSETGDDVLNRAEYNREQLRTGILSPKYAETIGYSHLSSIDEFQSLFSLQFEPVAYWGLESFAAQGQAKLNVLTPEAAEAWLDLIEQTAPTPEGLGQTDHLLMVARRSSVGAKS